MWVRCKTLVVSAVTGSGWVASLAIVNEVLQTLTLVCSLALGVYGLIELVRKKKSDG